MKTILILFSTILSTFNCCSQTMSVQFKCFSNPFDTSIFLTITNKIDSVVFINDCIPELLKQPNCTEAAMFLFQTGVTLNKPTPFDFIDVKRISKNKSYVTQIKLGSNFFVSDTVFFNLNLQLAITNDSSFYFIDNLLPNQIHDICSNNNFTLIEQRIVIMLIKKEFFSCLNNIIILSTENYSKFSLEKSNKKVSKKVGRKKNKKCLFSKFNDGQNK